MQINELKNRTRFKNERLTKAYRKFSDLIHELHSQSLNDNVISFINQQIDLINRNHDEKSLKKQIRISQHKIIQLLVKEHKLVPKSYYRNLWMVLGMSAFGIGIGTAFGTALGNMGFLGIGIPFGMVIGIAVGISMDNKAAKEGRQLKFDLGK